MFHSLRILLSCAILVLYGCLEWVENYYGAAIVCLLSLYLLRNGSWLALSIFSFYVAVIFIGMDRGNDDRNYRNVIFLLLLLLFICNSFDDNSKVRLKPYEKEVRQLLLLNEPRLLHKVDDLLEQYKGEESALLDLLRQNYSNNNNNKSKTNDENKKSKSTTNNPLSSNLSPIIQNVAARDEIYRLLRRNNILHEFDRLISNFKGNEAYLLQELKKEYPNEYSAKGSSTYGLPKGSVSTNYQDIIDNANYEARNNITNRIKAASSRSNGI